MCGLERVRDSKERIKACETSSLCFRFNVGTDAFHTYIYIRYYTYIHSYVYIKACQLNFVYANNDEQRMYTYPYTARREMYNEK